MTIHMTGNSIARLRRRSTAAAAAISAELAALAAVTDIVATIRRTASVGICSAIGRAAVAAKSASRK